MIESEVSQNISKDVVDNVANSDSEDDIIVRRKSQINLVLSDDEEDEERIARTKIQTDVDTTVSHLEEITNSKKDVAIVDAIDHSEQENDQLSPDCSNTVRESLEKFKSILDSDSEDEGIFNSLTGSCHESSNTLKTTSNDNYLSKPSKISALIDSDSEDDNSSIRKYNGSSEEDEPVTKTNAAKENVKPEKKKRTGSIRAAKDEAMREIRSESQRMLRESQVCLPYHRPRQRTLQEFLNRRKDLPILPTTLSVAAKVKMSGELVGKVLEEKEKEAELFYKSSSDSENEEGGIKAGFASAKITPDLMVVENNIKDISTTNGIQKLVRNDLNNCQGINGVVQQGINTLGVSRKLFDNSGNETEASKGLSSILKDNSQETTQECQNYNQRHDESKQKSEIIAMPDELFELARDEPMNIDERVNVKQDDNERIDKIQEIQEFRKTNHSQLKVSNESDQLAGNKTTETVVKYPEVHRNESMEDNAEDFVLKMSEDPYEMTDASKLNESKKADLGLDDGIKSKDNILGSSSSVVIESCDKDDFKNRDKPIGHVYGLPLPDFDDDKLPRTKTQTLADIMRLTPKLQGSPDMMIELSPPKVGVTKLMKRFLNHSVAKKPAESSPDVIAIRTEQTESGLRVINEVLPYRIPINEKNDDPELSKPGAKLIRLKEELQQQIAIQRTKEWKQKELEMKMTTDDDMYADEFSDCGMEDEDNVEAEEKELSHGDESESDEDDLAPKKAKKTYKSPFVDTEADVSEEESEERDDEEFNDEEDQEDADDNRSSGGDDKDEEQEESPRNRTSKLKRIIKAFEDDDSNDSEVKEKDADGSDADNGRHFRRTKTDIDMFVTDNSNDDWLSGTEGDLPVYQQQIDERSQSCETPSVANNSLSIVSPITQLTALNTGSESLRIESRSGQNPLHTIIPLSVETTPIEAKCYRECDSVKREKLQKKLFDDIKETPNDAELMSLCSGRFSDNPSDMELDKLIRRSEKTNVSDAELLDLCSGTFATQPLDVKNFDDHNPSLIQIEEDQCVAVPSSLDVLPLPHKSSKKESQRSDTISSPLKIVFSSDDENDTHNSQETIVRKRNLKKKVQKLNLSDEKEESDNGNLSDFDERENSKEEFVDYDSEENEIVVPKKNIRKTAAHFIDNEAELSESEWGSADEDERDLDKLDLEEGDLEDIDQNQVKKELEKMHMRQILDADKREVRLLQEMLLEDGELHSDSASRQRKFKWKNIDELGEDTEGHLQSLDEEAVSVDINEAESELEWRKQRLEREQFLQEQEIKKVAENVEEEAEDSQLFQLGMRALKKNKNNKIPNKDVSKSIVMAKTQISVTRHTVADLFASPGCEKKTFALKNAIHRGSFLARGEESLARLSVITKQNSDQSIMRPKNSRNFVFAHLSPAIESPVEKDAELDDKRNTTTTDSKLRKRRPAFSLTPVASKRPKKEYKENNTKKKLFNQGN